MKESLVIENLELHIGDHTLIAGGGVSIPFGTKIALVGRNGSGKSTLLKTIAAIAERKDITTDAHIAAGKILVPAEMTAALIAQDPVLPESSVQEYVGIPMQSSRRSWERFSTAMGIYELLPRRCSDLSGGQRMRVALARAVATGAELLLFDEPTNNLDGQGIDAFTQWLKSWSGTAVLVSHDRDFMDDIASQVVEIDEETKELRTYGGNYSFYRDRKDEEFASATKMYLQEREDRDRLEADARRKLALTRGSEGVSTNSYVRSRMAKLARGAKAQLGRIKRDLSSRTLPHVPRHPHFIVPTRDVDERAMLRLTDYSFTYPNATAPVLLNISATAYGGERILLQGMNGSGKSTLLRILADTAWRAPDMRIAWSAQNTLDLAGYDDIFSYATTHNVQQPATELRTIIGAALNRDIGSGKTERLSVGERQRVALALLFAADPDVILLDEPTNHLDLMTIELLEASLAEYRGTVIVATHDRRFIRNLMPDRVWLLENSNLREQAVNAR